MFLQSVFIRQNNEQLVEGLKRLGYKFNENTHGDSLVTTPSVSRCRAIPHEYFYSTDPHTTWRAPGRIDCGVNIDMFLALAGLNDSTDFMQWFVSENGDWFLCVVDKFDVDLANWLNSPTKLEWHKATTDEIVKRYYKK